jgi:formylglycine-generating enzyme required for sulfatase activity
VPVRSFEPNSWGIYQVHGNVWEWVEDRSHPNYDGAPSDGSAWVYGQTSDHLMRGGDFFFDPSYLRSAQRYMLPSNFRNYSVGFRIVRTINP